MKPDSQNYKLLKFKCTVIGILAMCSFKAANKKNITVSIYYVNCMANPEIILNKNNIKKNYLTRRDSSKSREVIDSLNFFLRKLKPIILDDSFGVFDTNLLIELPYSSTCRDIIEVEFDISGIARIDDVYYDKDSVLLGYIKRKFPIVDCFNWKPN